MKVLILKKIWVFLLPLTFLTSLGFNTNADVLSLIDSLTNEEVRIIHRALNKKGQVDWKREFKLNITNRTEKTRKVLSFLTAVYAEKMEKSKQECLDYLKSFYAEGSSESDPSKLQYKQFMKNRWQERQAKLESGEATLKGLLRNSKQDDLKTFECLSIDADESLEGFVILGNEEEGGMTSQELRIEPSVVSIFTSASSSSSSSSSSAASSSTPPTSVSSTSMVDVSDEAEELLSMLDERSAKIALQARLNNYKIPFSAFNFSVSEEAEKCVKVINYLNFVLERKTKKVLDKRIELLSGSVAHQFYYEKYIGYQKVSEDMWMSYMTNKDSPPPFHPVRSSSRKSGRSSRARK